jgi:nucleoside 2-deoxyribosyltransferase
MTFPSCPVCKFNLEEEPSSQGGNKIFNCLVCGKFKLTGTAQLMLPEYWKHYDDRRPVLSHFLRRMALTNTLPSLNDEMCKQIIEKQSLPSPFEQSDSLIRLAGNQSPGPGEAAYFNALSLQAMIGAQSQVGLQFVRNGTIEAGLTTKHDKGGKQRDANLGLALTFEGWKRFDELTRGAHAGRTAFMAMQYHDAEELKKILDDCFRRAVSETGYRLLRLDDDPRAGLIDDRIRVDIQSARFVVVDLSHDNAGAYWEAGYAEGLGKPVIYTCEEKKFIENQTHFDTNHLTTVLWSSDDYMGTADKLKATIRATIPEARREEDQGENHTR